MAVLRRLTVAIAVATLFLGVSSLVSASGEKPPKPEDVAERAILAYGSRAAILGIQRNGILRAQVKFHTPEGMREGKTATRFIRKPKLSEDLMSIELELPGTKYIIGYDGKDIWEVQDGEVIQPSPANIKAFRNSREHHYEALLRYKETNSKLEYVGTNKLGTVDMDIIDLISPEGVRTRYEVSRKSGRVIYVNYDEQTAPDAPVVKYRLYYKDFRIIQNTLVPYETQVFQDGKLIEERKIVESVFNVQLDEKAFKAENAGKPIETAATKQ